MESASDQILELRMKPNQDVKEYYREFSDIAIKSHQTHPTKLLGQEHEPMFTSPPCIAPLYNEYAAVSSGLMYLSQDVLDPFQVS